MSSSNPQTETRVSFSRRADRPEVSAKVRERELAGGAHATIAIGDLEIEVNTNTLAEAVSWLNDLRRQIAATIRAANEGEVSQ